MTDPAAPTTPRASTPEDEHRLAHRLSDAMLTKLAENRGKLHWMESSPAFLEGCLDAEVDELRQAIGGYLEEGSHDAEDVWREAADVANFAAMLAENATGVAEARSTPSEPLDVEELAQAMNNTWIETVHRDPMGRLSDLRILAADTIAQLRLRSPESDR